jgi:hypothetical protein
MVLLWWWHSKEKWQLDNYTSGMPTCCSLYIYKVESITLNHYILMFKRFLSTNGIPCIYYVSFFEITRKIARVWNRKVWCCHQISRHFMHNMLLPLVAYHCCGIPLRDYALCYMLAFSFASHNFVSLLWH